MEHTITAPRDGMVAELLYAVGDQVGEGERAAAARGRDGVRSGSRARRTTSMACTSARSAACAGERVAGARPRHAEARGVLAQAASCARRLRSARRPHRQRRRRSPAHRGTGCASACSSASPERIADEQHFARVVVALEHRADVDAVAQSRASRVVDAGGDAQPAVVHGPRPCICGRASRRRGSGAIPERACVPRIDGSDAGAIIVSLTFEDDTVIPNRVTLVDVGPRDGLQNEKQPVSAAAQDRAGAPPAGGRPARDRGHQLRQPEVGAADGRQRRGHGRHPSASPACATRCWCRT